MLAVPAHLELSPNISYVEFERNTGVDLEILCTLKDSRPYNISWYKGTDEITSDTQSVVHQVTDSSIEKMLVFDSNAGFSDSGTYRCVAMWDVFEDFVTVDVEVKGWMR